LRRAVFLGPAKALPLHDAFLDALQQAPRRGKGQHPAGGGGV